MKNRFLSILLCLMTLIGCQNKSSFSEIFFNSECGLPCWNNLIPGQSIEDGFQDWIDKSPFIDGSTISKISDRGFFDAIYIINFKDIKVGSNLYYKDHKLYALWISGKLNISLKNLILAT